MDLPEPMHLVDDAPLETLDALAEALDEPLALVSGHTRVLLSRAEPGDFVLRARLDEILAAASRMRQVLDQARRTREPEPRTQPVVEEERLLVDLRQEFQDPAFIAELVETWAASAVDRVEALRAACRSEDRRQLIDEAHGLKSPARTMGASRVADLARRIELDGRSSAWSDLAPLVQEVATLVPDSVARLRALIESAG